MKTYKIYKNDTGDIQSIKGGFSWPAFFFTWIWAYTKRLHLFATLFLIGIVLYFVCVRSESRVALGNLILLIFHIIWGSNGNELWAKKLKKLNYTLIANIQAESNSEAITAYTRK